MDDEPGLGAKGNENAAHFEALKTRERQGHEAPGTYQAAVAEIWRRDPARAAALDLPKPKR